ncbi:MAG: hypothetical protein ABMA02_11440 [Saprospiraceae bacterium]
MEARLFQSGEKKHIHGIRVGFDLEILINLEIQKLQKESLSPFERIKLAFFKNVLNEFAPVKAHYQTAIIILANTD